MSYYIDIQNATNEKLPIAEEKLVHLASLALRDHQSQGELTIRIVNTDEMLHLNHIYRKQNKTTNVLSFPSTIPNHISLDNPFLGDIVICATVLQNESELLQKQLLEHWALMVIHGVLHLLGYDHIDDNDAQKMQAIEIQLLAELGYANPYYIEE